MDQMIIKRAKDALAKEKEEVKAARDKQFVEKER